MMPSMTLSIVVMLLAAMFAMAGLYVAERRKKARLKAQWSSARRALERIQPLAGVENNLDVLLEAFSHSTEASMYAFYLLQPEKKQYTLRALRHSKSNIGQASPSYSGLAPYSAQPYLPPTSLPADAGMPEGARWIEENGTALLHISLQGGGILRAGPRKKRSGRPETTVGETVGWFAPVVSWLVQVEASMRSEEAARKSEASWRRLLLLVAEPETVVDQAFRVAMDVMELTGGELVPAADDALQGEATVSLDREDGRAVFACRYRTSSGPVERIFRSLSGRGVMDDRRIADCLRTACLQAEAFLAAAAGNRATRSERVLLLKRLASLYDAMSPWKTGHAEQMSRYATVIARELGLSVEEVQEIATAAWIANIGEGALEPGLMTKDGRFTDDEYDRMKSHAELGAAMAEMTLGEKGSIADAIRHHHERVDGRGYPSGLKGSAIPLGARIIAVVQTFLAAVHGRKHREPLAFGEALGRLEAAAGTMLDPEIVGAFVDWFSRKRADAGEAMEPLGVCWEMHCTPSSLCEVCPVYGQREKPCWTYENQACASHGKSCKQCFVYTEAAERSRGSAKK
ncbi:HD domain-containing phosphohydrolase [Paenibacillus sp.]|uniref:HD-GYP domain-containing protein n=1 Tax=Paenibacillus sp. TaxID=58172 RepID=UPI0028113DA7|nr:HD domain-containing phosphohydrolase [Paenibacillus sp.]